MKAGGRVPPVGLYVSDGSDWSHMEPVVGGASLGHLWLIWSGGGGVVAQSWVRGGNDNYVFYDGETIAPLAVR